jgi:hypothetical protein
MMTSKPMTNETGILSEAGEIAALLPWYVSGKISAADKARVDAYATSHPEVLEHITLARDEADVVFAANAEISAPRGGLERLQKSLAASPSARLHGVKASIIDRFGNWLGGLAPRQLAYAGVAAALAIAVQAASIGSLLSNQPSTGGYQTASGPESALGKGTFALIAFQPAAPQSTLTAFLASNGFVIVDGPKPGGMYRVRVSDKALTQADVDNILTKIKARNDLVSFATASGSAP